MAYVLGFIYADGAVEDCIESSRTCYLLLANNDINILKEMMVVMSSKQTIQKIDPRKIKMKEREYWCKTSYRVRIGNKLIYQDLIKLGLCPKKSLIIELPDIPSQYFEYFLRGYFDGDGCLNVEKTKQNRMNVIFTSGSKIFLEQLTLKISDIFPKIKSSISYGSGAYKLRYNWRNALMVAELIYRDTLQAPYLRYKYDRYIGFLNRKMSV